MIEYLQKLKRNDSESLSEKEQLELEHLKEQLQRYKEIEQYENQEIEVSEGSNSENASEGNN